MEQRIGFDFSNVRIHDNSLAHQSAKDINALAYTHKNNIVFGAGQYKPQTEPGKKLLAHELTHVLQQKNEPVIQKKGNESHNLEEARFITEDGVVAPEGKLQKSVFLALLNQATCRTVDEGLRGSGHSSDNCPYIRAAFAGHYDDNPLELERLIERYAPATRSAKNAHEVIKLMQSRVLHAVIHWKKTGKIEPLPGDLGKEISRAKQTGKKGRSKPGKLSLKSRSGANDMPAQSPASVMESLGKGRPIENGMRSKMETAFASDFSDVQIHTDNRAAALSSNMNARAFTIGNHIAFASSEYRPGTLTGDALMAHELAHVTQQNSAKSGSADTGTSYSALEHDADTSAVGAMARVFGNFKGSLKNATSKTLPRLKSGLKLQACRDTVKVCPKGKCWAVPYPSLGAGPVCICEWYCVPCISPSLSDYDGPVVYCSEPGCDVGPTKEVMGDNEVVKADGKKTTAKVPESEFGVGAHFTPLGEGAACGCIRPDNLWGDGNKADAIKPSGAEITDVVHPITEGMAAKANPYRPPQTKDPKPAAADIRPLHDEGSQGAKPTGKGLSEPVSPAKPTVPIEPQTPVKPIAQGDSATAAKPATPSGTLPQPKGIEDILAKNAPSRNPAMQETLAQDIRTYRKNSGIRRIDEPGTQGVPVEGGTVAVARTDVKTLDKKPFGGASPEALPAAVKGKPGTTGGTELTPANPIAADHAEHVALENLRVAIEKALESKAITRADLVGKNVWVRVEQEPCSSCAAGLDNPEATPGVIKQFSQKFPELTIEVRNARTSRSYYIKDGKPVK
jgi:hypothetical protein